MHGMSIDTKSTCEGGFGGPLTGCPPPKKISHENAAVRAAFKGSIGAYVLLNAKIQTATRNNHTQSESNA
eukprot:574166-Rhodomonas_salina.1